MFFKKVTPSTYLSNKLLVCNLKIKSLRTLNTNKTKSYSPNHLLESAWFLRFGQDFLRTFLEPFWRFMMKMIPTMYSLIRKSALAEFQSTTCDPIQFCAQERTSRVAMQRKFSWDESTSFQPTRGSTLGRPETGKVSSWIITSKPIQWELSTSTCRKQEMILGYMYAMVNKDLRH